MTKKKKKAPAAQQLIDSLLDEKTIAPETGADGASASEDTSASPTPFDFAAEIEIDSIEDLGNESNYSVELISSNDDSRNTNSGNDNADEEHVVVPERSSIMVVEMSDDEEQDALDLSLNRAPFENEDAEGSGEGSEDESQQKISSKASGFLRKLIGDKAKPVAAAKSDAEAGSSGAVSQTSSGAHGIHDEISVDIDVGDVTAANKNPEPGPVSSSVSGPVLNSGKPDSDVPENTLRLVVADVSSKSISKKSNKVDSSSFENETIDRSMATEIRPGALGGKPRQHTSVVGGSAAFTSAEATLKQSENLRIAQSRITQLENELERLRRENEQLASAGETLRRRSDELLSRAESVESQARESQRILDEEKKVLKGQIQLKERENSEMRGRIEELENRLDSNFKKIRVRERELEHRLEIVKMESTTLVNTKDKMILELKRQIDQLTHENDYGKQKTQELFNQYKEKQETIRRVVRALRIALTVLEGDEDSVVPMKKAE